MSQAQYDIYRSKVMALVRSLVLKSSATANAINASLEAMGIEVNLADPSGWKYYLNLNGQYHPTDRIMRVTSLDTLQTIEFKKEVLHDHRTTMREYRFGTPYYNALVAQHPEQEILIQGILNPVDIDTAIRAQEGEILYYDRELVEENETNLIPQLSLWCRNFMARWNVPAYNLVDDLYPAVTIANLVMLLPTVVLNLRLRNCHTHYAHSYHIREYLASHGHLDEYVDFLTKRQALWLYRNVRYLQRNAGKMETFRTLIRNVMTDRGMPLAEWRMRHNVRDQAEEVYPTVELSRSAINFGYNNAGADIRTIPQMLDAQQKAARGNAAIQAVAESEIREQMENSLSNRLDTKILESSILDLTDASPYTLTDTLLNHWMYLAATDRYLSVVTVDNPKSGGTITVSVKEAFLIFLYAYNKALGIELAEIPRLQAMMVRRDPLPTREQLYALVDPNLVPNQVIDAMCRDMIELKTYISIPAFSDAVYAIHAEKLRQREIYSNQEHYLARGQAEAAMQHMYCDYPIDLGVGTSYVGWFADEGLDLPSFTALEAELLAAELYAHCTGTNLKVTQSLKELQAAMLRLMAQLSSYSVQFLQSINSNPISIVDWPAVRPGNSDNFVDHYEAVHALDFDLQGLDTRRKRRDTFDYKELSPTWTVDSKILSEEKLGVDLDQRLVGHSVREMRVLNEPPGVLRVLTDIPELGPDTPVLSTYDYLPSGMQSVGSLFTTTTSPHYALGEEDRTTVQARYGAYLERAGSFETPIQDVVEITRLGSLWPFLRDE